MNYWLMGVTSILYLGVAGYDFILGDYGMGICFLAYSIANVGLIMAQRGI